MAAKPRVVPEGIVVFKDESVITPSPAAGTQGRPKKPKHLKRKLASAAATSDEKVLEELTKQKEELNKLKEEAAANFKKKVRKLVIKMHGDEAWNPDKYDQYIAGGVVGNRLLKKLKITLEQQAEFDRAVKEEKELLKLNNKRKRKNEDSDDDDNSDSDSDDVRANTGKADYIRRKGLTESKKEQSFVSDSDSESDSDS